MLVLMQDAERTVAGGGKGGRGGDWCGSTAKKIKYIERGPARPRGNRLLLFGFISRGRGGVGCRIGGVAYPSNCGRLWSGREGVEC